MTLQEQADRTPDLPGELPRYFIEIQWYDENHRSFNDMVNKRICDECKDRAGEEIEERVPVVDEVTGRVSFVVRRVPYGSNPMSIIRDCCAKQRNYISAQTPVLEAIFRVLLANGNVPTELEELRQQLSEWVRLETRPHAYAPELIERLIQNDNYYGLRRFNPES